MSAIGATECGHSADTESRRNPLPVPYEKKLLILLVRTPGLEPGYLLIWPHVAVLSRSSRDDGGLQSFYGLAIIVVIGEQMPVKVERHRNAGAAHDRLQTLQRPRWSWRVRRKVATGTFDLFTFFPDA